MTATVLAMNHEQITYPASFNKKELAKALEKYSGTPFFSGAQVHSVRLRLYFFSHSSLIKELDWQQKDYRSTRKFTGPVARTVCRHLGINSKHFY